MRVRELAHWLDATFEGDGERELRGAAELEKAGSEDLSFVSSPKYWKLAEASAAGCLIAGAEFPASGRTIIRAAEARGSFARALFRLYPKPKPKSGVHPSAVVGEDVSLGEDVYLGPNVVLADGVRIGARSRVHAGTTLGAGVILGEDCLLHPRVTLYDSVEVGHRAVLHSGCVIGADGFGFVMSAGRYEKFPQVGKVKLGNDVEVGANTCIDRAALGVTWIGNGVKLDNMVHIGHNCRIGDHVVIAAQTGLSGAVIVDDYAIIGGQVGIGDKARIESRAVLGSGCGILTSKIVRAGQTVWGTPARPLKDYLEQLAHAARLPQMQAELRQLREEQKRFAARLGSQSPTPDEEGPQSS